VGTLQIKKAFR